MKIRWPLQEAFCGPFECLYREGSQAIQERQAPMAALTTMPINLRHVFMGAMQRLRDLIWPRPKRAAPAWAYAPAPGKRRPTHPRPTTGPLTEPEWRPMWPGKRQRRQPSDDAESDS
jgi:hypothetical protein